MMPIDVCFYVGEYSMEKLPIALDIITVERIVFNVNDSALGPRARAEGRARTAASLIIFQYKFRGKYSSFCGQ